MSKSEIINFYDSIDNKYKVFSNFAKYPVTINGVEWPTNEHYFHAMKFEGIDEVHTEYGEKIIRNASTPAKTKYLGNQKNPRYTNTFLNTSDRTLLVDYIEEYKQKGVKIRPDWDTYRLEVMYRINKSKYDQYPELKELLLSTKNAIIQEASPTDSFWGIGNNGKGQNMLGRILMKIRDEYTASEKNSK